MRARACRGELRPRGVGAPAEDPDYRFAVVQAEIYRRHLRLAVERLDVTPLALYLRHLALWYLERERTTTSSASFHNTARPQRARTGIGSETMSTLLVDNYDSYTYNVFHLLAAACGEEPIVVHNDIVSWPALSRWDFDAIVLSPGPGRPTAGTTSACAPTSCVSPRCPYSACASATRALGTCSKPPSPTPRPSMHGRLVR